MVEQTLGMSGGNRAKDMTNVSVVFPERFGFLEVFCQFRVPIFAL